MTILNRPRCLHTVVALTTALLSIGCNGAPDSSDPPKSAKPESTSSGAQANAVTLTIKSWKDTEALIVTGVVAL